MIFFKTLTFISTFLFPTQNLCKSPLGIKQNDQVFGGTTKENNQIKL